MKWYNAILEVKRIQLLDDRSCIVNLENESFFMPRRLVFIEGTEHVKIRFHDSFDVKLLKDKIRVNLYSLLIKEKIKTLDFSRRSL